MLHSFIDSILKTGRKVVCMSTPLPTIGDDAPLGEVAKAREEVKASQRERTDLTFEFNRRIKAYCESAGADFIDLDPLSQGPDGLVKKSLLNDNLADHHYDRPAFAAMIQPLLKQYFEPAG